MRAGQNSRKDLSATSTRAFRPLSLVSSPDITRTSLENLRAALIGRYLVERELGRGGMATVYLARDVQHDRHVAIKVLHPALAVTLGQERFQREIRLAAGLQH